VKTKQRYKQKYFMNKKLQEKLVEQGRGEIRERLLKNYKIFCKSILNNESQGG